MKKTILLLLIGFTSFVNGQEIDIDRLSSHFVEKANEAQKNIFRKMLKNDFEKRRIQSFLKASDSITKAKSEWLDGVSKQIDAKRAVFKARIDKISTKMKEEDKEVQRIYSKVVNYKKLADDAYSMHQNTTSMGGNYSKQHYDRYLKYVKLHNEWLEDYNYENSVFQKNLKKYESQINTIEKERDNYYDEVIKNENGTQQEFNRLEENLKKVKAQIIESYNNYLE